MRQLKTRFLTAEEKMEILKYDYDFLQERYNALCILHYKRELDEMCKRFDERNEDIDNLSEFFRHNMFGWLTQNGHLTDSLCMAYLRMYVQNKQNLTSRT